MDPEKLIRENFTRLANVFSEQTKRLWAVSEAISLGYGGVTIVHKATGLSRQTIRAFS